MQVIEVLLASLAATVGSATETCMRREYARTHLADAGDGLKRNLL